MEKSSQIAWKIVPLRHFFPLKVVPLIEVLLYNHEWLSNCTKAISFTSMRRKQAPQLEYHIQIETATDQYLVKYPVREPRLANYSD
jgi:hypothetical protein